MKVTDAGPRFEGSGLRVEHADAELQTSYHACDAVDAPSRPTEPAPPSAPEESPPPKAAPETPAQPPPPLQPIIPLQPKVGGLPLAVQVQVDSAWDKGHCDTVEVINRSDHTLVWSFSAQLDGQLAKTWSCQVQVSNDQAVFRGADFNRELRSGDSAWLGYCIDFRDTP